MTMSHSARRLASGSILRFLTLVGAPLVSTFIMPFIVRMLGDRLYGVRALNATRLQGPGAVPQNLLS